ncbi:MAG: TrmH family RNA methyltransferase [Patescibacteria group bacterium]|nr:TrmH family RNA methyltransferase [Patescibacteria group bacterium]
MKQIVVIAHNLRSTHNVGSLLRTAEGLGVSKIYLTGYTPYPLKADDPRLPHLAAKLQKQIHKTALDAEEQVDWEQSDDIGSVLAKLKMDGYAIAAIEQSGASMPLPEYTSPDKLALLVGREVEGIEPEILKLCDAILEIPMFGQKESFNVVQAAAMALYHCRFNG